MAENDETTRDPAKPGESTATPDEGAVPAQPENRRARRAAAAKGRSTGGKPIPRRPGAEGLDASELMDDALARATDKGARWLKGNFNILQWLIVAGAATWIGWQIYSWRTDKTAAKVGEDLAAAVAADLGKVGSAEDEGKRDNHGLDTRKAFPTEEARVAAATEGYKKVAAERPGTPAEGLAKLGLAGVLYDQGKSEEAKKVYEEVLGSELAKMEPEAKGRALEGIGLALEQKGDKDGALKKFAELENADIPGFKELAQYHQGRLLHAKGDDAAAVEKLKKAIEKLKKETTSPDMPSYLLESVRALLTSIDPKAVPEDSPDEKLQKALKEMQSRLPAGVTQIPLPAPKSP